MNLLRTCAVAACGLLSLAAHAQQAPAAAPRPDSTTTPAPVMLAGTVRDEVNNPLAGVTVKLLAGANAPICTTNGHGRYLLTSVPATGGTITVSCVGFISQQVNFPTAGELDVVLQPEPGFRQDRKTRQQYRRFNRSASASSKL